HPVLQFAAHQNYRDFYQDEIQSRKALLFPPFCDICVVGFNGMDEVQTEKAAGIFMQTLHRAAERQKETIPMKAMGPSRAGIYKLNNRYRYRIVIKCRAGKRFKQLLGETLRQVLKQKAFADVTVFADINGDIGV
ncbi:MAG TPA: primosomal protein N', partial [Firmicutes bacterium]|nr:primosomal protein N' [Bacillota bacterium]